MKKITLALLFLMALGSCDSTSKTSHPNINRPDMLPADITKRDASTDHHSPILVATSEFEEPVALGSGVNTSGAEDSPFITPNGKTLYFFFTPDARVPPEKQVLDKVSGIWVSYQHEGE